MGKFFRTPSALPAGQDRHNTNQKKQPELFKSRLEKFIENTKQGKIYGEWNDYGRLLDY